MSISAKKRQKRIVPLTENETLYSKTLSIFNLFANKHTFKVINLTLKYEPLTYDELISLTKKYKYMEESLIELQDAGLLKLKGGLYHPNKTKIQQVNQAVKTIGKYARK